MTHSLYDLRCGRWPRCPDVRTVKLPRTLELEEARHMGGAGTTDMPGALARFLIELLQKRGERHRSD
jgi:hypothetical protein